MASKTSGSADEYEVDEEFLAIGRTFAEYARMFDLDTAELNGRSVLDCGGGAGSFTATAAAAGATARAIDPMYGPPATALEPRLEAAIADTAEQLGEKRDLFVWDGYGDVATRIRYLRAAYHRFLADYADNPDRYAAGRLPDLPVRTDAVDLALSANLLFLYDDRLDREFHVGAVRELARIASEEVRVFPLTSLDASRSVYVDAVVDRLREEGLEASIRGVSYEFQPGSTEMLVVSGPADAD